MGEWKRVNEIAFIGSQGGGCALDCSDIEKIAMVGESTWEKWMALICKPFTMSTIKYFDAGQAEQARLWLRAA